jgi:DNA-binding transcriptional ArsR family regulator
VSAPARAFDALGDPTRLRLVEWLSSDGPASATRLAERLPITRQAVVRHLSILERAGVASSERVGREVRFRLEPDRMAEAAGWLEARAAEWDRRLERFRELVEDVKERAPDVARRASPEGAPSGARPSEGSRPHLRA